MTTTASIDDAAGSEPVQLSLFSDIGDDELGVAATLDAVAPAALPAPPAAIPHAADDRALASDAIDAPTPFDVDDAIDAADDDAIDAADDDDAARAATLLARLNARLPMPLASVTLTYNRSRIVSTQPAADHDTLHLRVHRCFADADDAVLDSVARLIDPSSTRGQRRQALVVVRTHFGAHAAAARTRPTLRPIGQAFDLAVRRDAINRDWFDDNLDVAITWGRRRAPRRPRRGGVSIRLGSYSVEHDLIRIHPALDRPDLPSWVLDTIIHHEMLHAALPPVQRGLRRIVHSATFRRRERAFSHHARTERWLERNLLALVHGTPFHADPADDDDATAPS
ncbi:MAG: hypothetical protein AAF772_13250 [Acidobacteriota bacterium]